MSQPPMPPSAPPPPPPAAAPAGDNRNLMLVLSYLGILALIPLLSEKNDADVQWHAKHGLVISVASLLLLFVCWGLSAVMSMVVPVVGCVGCVLPLIATVAIIGVHIAGMMKALKGERLIIPGISEFANRF